MDLKSYLAILRRRTDIIAITLALAVLVTSVGTHMIEPRYRASTTLRLTTVVQGSADWIAYDLQYADRLMNTYTKIAASTSVKTQIMRDLDLTEAPQISAEIMANTELMKITVEYHEPELAAQTANRVAELLIHEGGKSATETTQNTQKIMTTALEQSKGELEEALTVYDQTRLLYVDGDVAITLAKQTLDLKQKIYENLLEQHQQSQIREALQTQMLTVLDPALSPKQPFQPDMWLNLVLGLLLGLIGGLGLAFLFENLSDAPLNVKPAHQLMATHPSAVLPLTALDTPSFTIHQNSSDDIFRRLYEIIWDKNQTNRRQKILILGVEPGNDKASVAFNLACTVAQAGQQVVLVDSDFQLPSVHQLFNLPNQFGLGSLLTQNSQLKDVTWINKTHGIHLITSGPAPDNSAGFINSVQMDSVLNRLATQFNVVLLNGPTLGGGTEVTALAMRADGLVIVTEDGYNWQERESIVRTMFAQIGVPLLAVIRRPTSANVHQYDAQFHATEHHSNGTQRLFHPA